MTSANDTSSMPTRNWGWNIIPLLAFAAIAGVFAYALTSGDPSNLPSALVGKPIPDATFEPLKNITRNGSPVPGFGPKALVQQAKQNSPGTQRDVAVVNFWASWCGPCRLEHPQIDALAKHKGVAVFGVNYKDEPVAARRYLTMLGNPYSALGVDTNGRGAIEWGVTKMPETFVISPTGTIAYKFSGPITKDVLENKILPAIERARQSN